MHEHENKPKQDKTHLSRSTGFQKKSGRNSFQFTDARSAATQSAELQAVAGDHSGRPEHTIQKKESNTGLPESSNKRVSEQLIQRVQANPCGAGFVSSFNPALIIDANKAAITVSAISDSDTGGHAEVYIELEIAGKVHELRTHMTFVNRTIIDTRSYTMGGIIARNAGGSQTYAITSQQAKSAMEKAKNLRDQVNGGKLVYTYYVPKLWNMNFLSGVTYMNCADFAQAILNAAGVSKSSGILSMPKTVANE
ncbi:MAG: hypothetical protein XXXJIFNMEKO3_00630 [Candidatus Erwinia impunctatus]|nr:hypothetical protein XXXJIFNMEKO_00630 [Culicoides impunctatus]